MAIKYIFSLSQRFWYPKGNSETQRAAGQQIIELRGSKIHGQVTEGWKFLPPSPLK